MTRVKNSTDLNHGILTNFSLIFAKNSSLTMSNTAYYLHTTSHATKRASASAPSEADLTIPSEGASHEKAHKKKMPPFKGGGIMLKPRPFYVRNHDLTLREFDIF